MKSVMCRDVFLWFCVSECKPCFLLHNRRETYAYIEHNRGNRYINNVDRRKFDRLCETETLGSAIEWRVHIVMCCEEKRMRNRCKIETLKGEEKREWEETYTTVNLGEDQIRSREHRRKQKGKCKEKRKQIRPHHVSFHCFLRLRLLLLQPLLLLQLIRCAWDQTDHKTLMCCSCSIQL